MLRGPVLFRRYSNPMLAKVGTDLIKVFKV
jgi:hypothetical protein